MIFPRTYFDADRCTELVNHLKRYRRQINQITQEAGAPLHDEHSHAADAFRYLAQSLDMMNNDNWGKPLPVNTRWVV
jgi:phage terminase large subunit